MPAESSTAPSHRQNTTRSILPNLKLPTEYCAILLMLWPYDSRYGTSPYEAKSTADSTVSPANATIAAMRENASFLPPSALPQTARRRVKSPNHTGRSRMPFTTPAPPSARTGRSPPKSACGSVRMPRTSMPTTTKGVRISASRPAPDSGRVAKYARSAMSGMRWSASTSVGNTVLEKNSRTSTSMKYSFISQNAAATSATMRETGRPNAAERSS